MQTDESVRYAGFWIRLAASFVDSLWLNGIALFAFPLSPQPAPVMVESILLLTAMAFIVLICWWIFGTTPGKWALRIRIVDAETLQPPSRKAFALRLLGYFMSWFAFFLGFIQIAFSQKHRGFHDRLAGTSVIHILRNT